MSLKDNVNVTIDRQTRVATRQGFGTPLIVGESTVLGSDRVRSYSDPDAILVDFDEDAPEYLMALAAFSQDPAPLRVKIGRKIVAAEDGESWTDAIAAIVDADNDWYGINISSAAKADILEVAAWTEARSKIFGARSADADIFTSATTDVASSLVALAYSRTFLMAHKQADTKYVDAAWMGQMLPQDPGSATWKFKTLAGIPVDTLTDTESQYALSKNANTYERVAGINITTEGKMAEPEYIDVIIGLDWLIAEMSTRIFTHLANVPKIPYTNAGIQSIESDIRTQLDIAVDRSVIAPEPPYTVSAPDVLDTDVLDRAERKLRDVTFAGRLAGAIHNITVRGTVTV